MGEGRRRRKVARAWKGKVKAHSDQRNFQPSHSEHEGCKPSSSSKKGHRHSSSSKRDKKTKAIHEENIAPSISTEGGMGATPSHEENLTHSTSPQGTPRHTSNRRNLKNAPYNQRAIKTSPTDQEHFKPSPDIDSTHEGVKTCSSPQGDVSHVAPTDEGLKHAQEEEKTSIRAKEGCWAVLPIQWGLAYAPIPKEKATSFPAMQRKVSHTISQLDMRSSISYKGKDTALQHEYGALVKNPSVLGGHRYCSRLFPCNLLRIPRKTWRFPSNLSPKEGIRPFPSDQHAIRLSYSLQRDRYQPCALCSLRPLDGSVETEGLLPTLSSNLGLRYAPRDQQKFRNLFSNQKRVRPSTSALFSHQLTPSGQGGNRAPWFLKWNP